MLKRLSVKAKNLLIHSYLVDIYMYLGQGKMRPKAKREDLIRRLTRHGVCDSIRAGKGIHMIFL